MTGIGCYTRATQSSTKADEQAGQQNGDECSRLRVVAAAGSHEDDETATAEEQDGGNGEFPT